MKKKIAALFLLLIIALTACGGAGDKGGVKESKVERHEGSKDKGSKGDDSGKTKKGFPGPMWGSSTPSSEAASASEGGYSESNAAAEEGGYAEAAAAAPASDFGGASRSFDYSDLSTTSFQFSSGAGGWSTSMMIKPDGSFKGLYSDSDMGVTGPGYPGGTLYYCEFYGQLSAPRRVEDTVFCADITDIGYKETPGREEIIDGVKYIYTTPYGIEGTDMLYFYLPGTKVADLSEEYIGWVQYSIRDYQTGETAEELDFYGIYNEAEGNGFYSYDIKEYTLEMLKDCEENAAILGDSIDNDPLSQFELTEKSGQLFQNWDNLLNMIWSDLKTIMDEDDFEQLRLEQREWIRYKEEEVDREAAGFEGGSAEPMVRNLRAAALTKDRVYELLGKY